MPSFTGQRARRYWKAVATRDAVEHAISTGDWPNPSWNKARVIRTFVHLFEVRPDSDDLTHIWECLDTFIDSEERNDKLSLLAKLIPF